MKKIRQVIAAGTFVLLAAGTYWYLYYSHPAGLQAPAALQENTDKSLVVKGVVVPVRHAALTLPVNGVIAEVPVQAGEQVKAGQLLLRLESGETRNKLRQAQADKERAEAIIDWVRQNRTEEIATKQAAHAAAQAELSRVEADWQRIQQLYAIGAVSQQRFEQAYADYIQSKADAQAAQSVAATAVISTSIDTILPARRAELESARAHLEQIQSTVRQSELYAPFDGTVALLNAKIGEYVTTTAPVMYLGDCSAWKVHTEDVTEEKVERIKQGAAVVVTFAALPDLKIPGKVTGISNYGEKKAGGEPAYQAVVELERQDLRLRWNMTASIRLASE
ncbi:HlyD family secretion protein [Sporomusa aerivorans]|uniref:HlyD family secretion protein n=1 Tax=Sporomusa aerivorans TaxID=204936 RepID=UPI00352B35D9